MTQLLFADGSPCLPDVVQEVLADLETFFVNLADKQNPGRRNFQSIRFLFQHLESTVELLYLAIE